MFKQAFSNSFLNLLFSLLLFSISSNLKAQIAPHPKLLQEIKTGVKSQPYALKNIGNLKQKGVDAPWSSQELKAQKLLSPFAGRSFGPSNVPTGSWKALVILVQFSDKPKQVNAAYFDNMLFGSGAGTLKDFYKKITYNNLDIVTVNLPGSIDWKSAPQSYAYYCNNQNGLGSYPQNSQKLTEDLVNMVNPAVDFSQYDNNHDGYVDALFIVHTGPGAEYTGNNADIWSHAWSTYNEQILDGVKVSRYSIEPEYWQTPGDMTIGVFAHELGHAAFGLPDLYDRDYTSQGLGDWSLMAGGSWNGLNGDSPAYPDAYCRIQMGYVTPVVVTTNIAAQSIPNAENNTLIYKLWKGGVPGSQYYLVENRQQTSFDQTLPNSGLLVYHIDETVLSQNDNEWYPGHTSNGHYLAALEQADGLFNLDRGDNRGDAGDPFPGNLNKFSFANSTSPDSKDYKFSATGVALKNISSSSLTMHADFEVISTDTVLRVVVPNGGEKWPAGYTKQIILDALNTGDVRVEYTSDNGQTWNLIGTANPASLRPASQSLRSSNLQLSPEQEPVFNGAVIDWIVPNSPSALYKIRAICNNQPSLTDQSDAAFTVFPVPAGQFSVQFNYDAYSVTGANGNLGAIFLPSLNEFWTSRWASELLHRWTKQGTLISQFSIPGVTGILAMTTDGTNVYATANNSNLIYIINPNTRTLSGTITLPFNPLYITYDPTADGAAGGFWTGSWDTDLQLFSRSGSILKTIPYSNLGTSGNIGAAYDNFTPGGPYIWLCSQGNGQKISQIQLSTGLPTGIEHDLLSDIGSGVSQASSGGLFISSGIITGKATIGGMLQGSPNHLFGYQLTDLAPNISVIYPNGGEYLRSGRNVKITWTSGMVSNVKVEYTTNNGTNWTVISSSTPAINGNLSWIVPLVTSSQCKIKISDASNSSVYDESDNSFSISLTGPVTETEPNNTASTANYMEIGDSLDAVITPIGDVDYYKFTANAGDTVMIYSFDRNSSTLDGSIRLLNESDAELFYNDDFMSINASRIVYPVTSQGTYYIRYSYFQNYTGLQSASLPKGENEFKNLLNKELKGPQLANDNGEYKINLKRFTTSSPQLSSFGWYYLNYNAIRLAIGLYPNGLPTTVRLDYGTTSGYGSSIDLTQSPVNSLNEFYIPYLLNGLQANTTYHFRVTLTNSKGTYVSGDMSLTTPSVPEGYVFQISGTENNLYSVSFADQNNGSAVGDYVILHTTNGGTSWIQQSIPNGICTWFRGVDFTDVNNGTIVGECGVILRTTNAGTTWTQQSSGTGNRLNSVCFTDLNNGVSVGNNIILRTTNGGTTWTQQSYPVLNNPQFMSVSFIDANTGYIAGAEGAILKTTNGGTSWIQQSSSTGNWLYGVCFTDQNNGSAVGDYVILHTTNGGVNWNVQNTPVNTYFRSVSFTDQNNGTVVGGNGIILKTTNAGAAWTQPSSGTTAWLNSLSTKNNNTVIVGDWGMILKASSSSSPVKWQVSLNISDGNSQNSNSLTFGQARTATDGLDAALGEITLPPAPPSGVFDARFKLPVTPAEYSLKDYRADTLKSVDWRLSFQPGSGGYPLTFTWNPSNLPEGAVYLKDVINGSIINVNMKSQSSYTLSDEDITSLKIEFRTEICSNVVLSNDWNMISVPVNSPDMQSSVLFPQATSPTYGFSGSYQSQSTLETGRGYWIRYPQSEVVSICGAPVSQSNSLKVTAGWNLVGVFDRNIQVNQITAQPEGILSSPFYGYMGSYQSATELQSGRGYWIRSSQSGVINLNYSSSSSALAKENTIPPEVKGDWGKIIVEDNIGRRAVLYRSLNEANLFKYDLPPMPPLGIFDVRYTTDRYVETAGNSKIKISSAAFPVKIKSEGMDLRIKDNIGGSILNKLLRKGETFTINNNQLDLLSVETVEIPLQYELSQNYPNPFNPSTTIRYAIPEKTQLSLTIYNQLGEKVKELVNTVMEAGEYHLEWNAENCASGIYLCELKTQSFRSVRKLILLK